MSWQKGQVEGPAGGGTACGGVGIHGVLPDREEVVRECQQGRHDMAESL